ncbi:hypothetical protein BDP27DRAFT_1536658 [Rhodocollybia butyracea]|uniref:HNH nuclease domain-containing protein n=1 Tax=Rhodocollybia butyracea TaxID=206335 RepID=A0A9P5PNS6_9AGAR|nr:hypothetical protein BDP27DRAFT_1536658 [Rhodocollybia butyracea]
MLFYSTIPPPTFFEIQPLDAQPVSIIEIFHHTAGQRFLVLCARDCPNEARRPSGVLGLPTALIDIVDACRILTGVYEARYSFRFVGKHDNCCVEGELSPEGRYSLSIVDQDKNLLEYGLYENFYTRRPPTHAEVPSHWFTVSSPQPPINGAKGLPDWALLSITEDYADMRYHMSKMAKDADGYQCALTRVSSPAAAEGAHVVPTDEDDFLFHLINTHYVERDIAEQLNPACPSPPTLPHYQKIHDIRNYLTLAHIYRPWDEFIIVFYPILPGEYYTFFVGPTDGHDSFYHHAKLCLADRTDPYLLYVRFAHMIFRYKIDISGVLEPSDALPELVRGEQQSTKKGKTRDLAGDDLRMDRGEDNDESEDESETFESEGPIAFQMLFKEAEAQGKELSVDMENLVGSYHPDRKRIVQTAAKYLEHHPAVGLRPESVLSYPVVHIS